MPSPDIQLLTDELILKNLNSYSTGLLAMALGLRSIFLNCTCYIFCRTFYWKKRKSKDIFISSFSSTNSSSIFSFQPYLCPICYKKQ